MSAIVPIDWNPDETKLRRFAWAWLVFLGGIWPALLLLRGHAGAAGIVGGIGLAGAMLGLIRPRLLRPAWLLLLAASWPIGWVVSQVAMLVLFFLILTPIALALRLFGRDALNLSGWRSDTTTWRARAKVDLARYLGQD
jgi:hypothetical protein